MNKFVLLFLLLTVLSCKNTPIPTGEEIVIEVDQSNEALSKKLERHLDLVLNVTDSLGFTHPPLFEAAFIKGASAQKEKEFYKFRTHRLGMVQFPSGQIILSDPIFQYDAVPLPYNFPVGEFPVDIAFIDEGYGELVGFVRVVFSSDKVDSWKPVWDNPEEPTPLNSPKNCFTVDAGQAFIIDTKANTALTKKGVVGWKKAFSTTYRENNYGPYLYEFDVYDLAAFPTGYGDGCYVPFIGLDEKGNTCQLLCDFDIIEWRRP